MNFPIIPLVIDQNEYKSKTRMPATHFRLVLTYNFRTYLCIVCVHSVSQNSADYFLESLSDSQTAFIPQELGCKFREMLLTTFPVKCYSLHPWVFNELTELAE